MRRTRHRLLRGDVGGKVRVRVVAKSHDEFAQRVRELRGFPGCQRHIKDVPRNIWNKEKPRTGRTGLEDAGTPRVDPHEQRKGERQDARTAR